MDMFKGQLAVPAYRIEGRQGAYEDIFEYTVATFSCKSDAERCLRYLNRCTKILRHYSILVYREGQIEAKKVISSPLLRKTLDAMRKVDPHVPHPSDFRSTLEVPCYSMETLSIYTPLETLI